MTSSARARIDAGTVRPPIAPVVCYSELVAGFRCLDIGGREAYVAKVKAAAEALVAERLLLPADAAAYVETANACDQF